MKVHFKPGAYLFDKTVCLNDLTQELVDAAAQRSLQYSSSLVMIEGPVTIVESGKDNGPQESKS